MMNKQTRMDVYSDHQVPMDVACFCRTRKFMPSAVALGSALRAKDAAQAALDKAHEDLEKAEAVVKSRVQAMESTMREMGEK